MSEVVDVVVRPRRGGRITRGVVRIGDAVRRPASAGSPFVASLLDLLESRGFTEAPRYLGRDQTGRDTFSCVPGWVPPKFRPWTDAQVAAAGALARAMHEAIRGGDLAGQRQVGCHHDLGPNDAVFQDDMPVAFIDFDMAAPGSPLEDVVYTTWTWCISSSKVTQPVNRQVERVRCPRTRVDSTERPQPDHQTPTTMGTQGSWSGSRPRPWAARACDGFLGPAHVPRPRTASHPPVTPPWSP
ncbi:phosphotransferase [Streptomyces sp. NPDC002688]|uniref:phosphotransferase n=1 Tax=Streptomyces sp. NPDC002688 TaxID=3154423 RepID=UPI0033323AAB